MVVVTEPKDDFALKALIVIAGILGTALMGFFIWLATAIIDVRERVVRIDTETTSLLETRTQNIEVQQQHNTQELNDLSKKRN